MYWAFLLITIAAIAFFWSRRKIPVQRKSKYDLALEIINTSEILDWKQEHTRYVHDCGLYISTDYGIAQMHIHAEDGSIQHEADCFSHDEQKSLCSAFKRMQIKDVNIDDHLLDSREKQLEAELDKIRKFISERGK